jgi:type VI secretion system protein
MRCGLLDALTGRFPDGERVADVPEEEQRLHSILGNLARLFNTRQGSLVHVPDFGLPDITDVSRALPERVDALRRAIRDAVQRYEPRLQRVRVELEPQAATSSRLVFLLVAEMGPGARIELQTTIRSDELVEVSPKRLGEPSSGAGASAGRPGR